MIKRLPLSVYAVGVLVAWAIVLFVVSQFSPTNFETAIVLCTGFFLGVLYMYLRIRVSHLDK
ncbi:MAG: hypothetical protein ABSE76_01325 [Minisyncoccia bacterium]